MLDIEGVMGVICEVSCLTQSGIPMAPVIESRTRR